MGTISIIIPVYNVEKYIDICLTSILNQTYSNLEILLVDDGSTDNSGLICDKYAQIDRRVKVFHKINEGVSSARNLGLEKATGEYISFVDPDDWIEPNMYAVIKKQFDMVDIEAVFCGFWENFSRETARPFILHMPEKQDIVNGRDALYQCLIGIGYGYFTSVWNKVFKADFLKKSVLFEDFLIGEDEVWLVKVLQNANRISLIRSPFYHWLQRENSVLHSSRNYVKWYSALAAKSAVISAVQFDELLLLLSTAKTYNDMFDVVWKAYVEGDYKISLDFMEKLNPYEKAFYKSEYFSKMKKLKFFTLKLMINFRFPKKIIKTVGLTNSYQIKEIINGI